MAVVDKFGSKPGSGAVWVDLLGVRRAMSEDTWASGTASGSGDEGTRCDAINEPRARIQERVGAVV